MTISYITTFGIIKNNSCVKHAMVFHHYLGRVYHVLLLPEKCLKHTHYVLLVYL